VSYGEASYLLFLKGLPEVNEHGKTIVARRLFICVGRSKFFKDCSAIGYRYMYFFM
jgi:hypothetical protein